MPTTTPSPARPCPGPPVPRCGARPPPGRSAGGPTLLAIGDGGLCRSQPGDRDAVRGTAHVVHSGLVAEVDRGGIPAVLSADADLEAGARRAPPLDRPEHQLPDARLVECLERVVAKDPQALLVDVVGQKPPRVVA